MIVRQEKQISASPAKLPRRARICARTDCQTFPFCEDGVMPEEDQHTTHAPDPNKETSPSHATHLDTVAQKPPNRSGPRKTTPASNPHKHHDNPTPGAFSPPITAGTVISDACDIAAGIPAVYQTARFAVGEMGLVRGVGDCSSVNKKDGFDCQSCAWPSPGRAPATSRSFARMARKPWPTKARPSGSRRSFSASTRSPNCASRAISGSASRGG